jgi:transcriptional regulator with XRE-family HTH domain
MTRRDPETNPAASLGGELRRARVSAGFSSQDALAAALGFDRTVITKAETRERPPTDEVLAAWCQACRLDVDLFERLVRLARRADGPVPTWFEDWLEARPLPRTPPPARTADRPRGRMTATLSHQDPVRNL